MVAAITQKDRLAFAEIYDRYAPNLLGLATRILRDSSAAEDVMQESFLSLWNKAHLYNPAKGVLLTWLYRICRNQCLDRLKRASYRQENPASALGIAEFSGRQWQYNSDKMQPDEIYELVTLAVGELRAGERDLIELSFFKGLSHSEISAEKKMPLGTVKSTIAGALKKMRSTLNENWQIKGEWIHE